MTRDIRGVTGGATSLGSTTTTVMLSRLLAAKLAYSRSLHVLEIADGASRLAKQAPVLGDTSLWALK